MQAALDSIPWHEAATALASSQGAAWTYNGFSTVWHRFKTGLEGEGLIAPGLTLKGLRHTVATTLREAGLDQRRIAELLGQKPPSMARHYSRSANLDESQAASFEVSAITHRQDGGFRAFGRGSRPIPSPDHPVRCGRIPHS